jgi:23S rRNA pseudouridine2605 synthase
MERIQKIISNCGYCSRRHAEELIKAEEVKINDKVASIGDKADFPKDSITVEGKKLTSEKKRYILIYKTVGYTCTLADPHESKNISVLLEKWKIKERVYSVGRLDKESEGLLILTNDGDFANKVAHPRYDIKKTYVVEINKSINHDDLKKIEDGVEIEEKKAVPDKVESINSRKIMITLHEGRRRIIRRIMEKVGYSVIRLVRIKIGEIDIKSLGNSELRDLTKDEIQGLLK